MEWHSKRLDVLVETKPDVFACETIPCLQEARALVKLIQKHPTMKSWLTFSCKDGQHLSSGEDFNKVFEIVQNLDTNNLV